MSNSQKPISELTNSEIREKIKKHTFYLELLKDEETKRKRRNNASTGSKTPPKKQTNEINATVNDIKKTLDNKGISYKASMNKSDLTELVRKHGLIRAAEKNYENRKK